MSKVTILMLKVIAALHLVLGLSAIAFAGHYLSVAFSRVLYPYDLDFIEDAIFMQAWRVAQNQAVFRPPNADFVPQIYMPLYTWLGGLLLKLSGPSIMPLRFLSLAATLITASLLYAIGRREGASRLMALGGAALFLAGYRINGGFYDLARVDMLFVALSLAGMTMAVYKHDSNWGLFCAGALMGLAFLSKQNGLFLAAVVAGYFWLAVRWRIWIYVLSLLLVGGVPALLLQVSTGGWFSYYVIDVAFANPLLWRRLANTLLWELAGSMTILALSFALAGVLSLRQHRWQTPRRQPWLLFITAALVVTLAGRSSVGGNLNHLIPAYTLLCLAPALLAAEIKRWPAQRKAPAGLILMLALLAQFGPTRFNFVPNVPAQFRPTSEMRLAGDRFIEEIGGTRGEVFVMLHPYYTLMAGKEPSVHVQSLWHARGRGREPLPADLVKRIEDQEYALIISDESAYFETEPALVALLEANYVRAGAFTSAEAPPTLGGVPVRPITRYVPRQAAGSDR